MDPSRRRRLARANALRRQLEADEPASGTKNAVEQINADLDNLDPELDALLDRANQSLAQSASFLELAELQRQLAYTVVPLEGGEAILEVEAQRVGKALDNIAQAQQLWSATRSRPETSAAEALVGGSVQRSIDELNEAAANLKAWRARVLVLSDRLTDRIGAVNALNDRLRAAQLDERTNSSFHMRRYGKAASASELRRELPQFPDSC